MTSRVLITDYAERTAKWNWLLRLAAELGSRAEYADGAALASAA